MKKITKLMLLLAFVCLSAPLYAGTWLARDTTILSIAVTTGSATSNKFWIDTSGGTYGCAGNKIYFSQSDTNPDTFKRLYATALAAISAEKKVNVYQYTNVSGTCYGQSIEILRGN